MSSQILNMRNRKAKVFLIFYIILTMWALPMTSLLINPNSARSPAMPVAVVGSTVMFLGTLTLATLILTDRLSTRSALLIALGIIAVGIAVALLTYYLWVQQAGFSPFHGSARSRVAIGTQYPAPRRRLNLQTSFRFGIVAALSVGDELPNSLTVTVIRGV